LEKKKIFAPVGISLYPCNIVDYNMPFVYCISFRFVHGNSAFDIFRICGDMITDYVLWMRQVDAFLAEGKICCICLSLPD
jgi:hypothetical protein